MGARLLLYQIPGTIFRRSKTKVPIEDEFSNNNVVQDEVT
jgi:hypothetical protein